MSTIGGRSRRALRKLATQARSWDFARHLGIDPGTGEHARLEFWARELERCYARTGQLTEAFEHCELRASGVDEQQPRSQGSGSYPPFGHRF
jgi:hypothetical protein